MYKISKPALSCLLLATTLLSSTVTAQTQQNFCVLENSQLASNETPAPAAPVTSPETPSPVEEEAVTDAEEPAPVNNTPPSEPEAEPETEVVDNTPQPPAAVEEEEEDTHNNMPPMAHGGDHQHMVMAHNGPSLESLPRGANFSGVQTREVNGTARRPDGIVHAAFRTHCKFSHFNYDDAIVGPGQRAFTHLHAYFGNSEADYRSTPQSIRNSGNSSCDGGHANRSAYWFPAVIDANGKPVVPDQIQVYYKVGYQGGSANDIEPLPDEIRMIAGNAKSQEAQQHINYSCRSGGGGAKHFLNCNGILVMSVSFPSCWDGKNLDSPDHQSHMAYGNGPCPASHPVRIPTITYNIFFDNAQNASQWRLSSDAYPKGSKPGGYSGHADYMEGWDKTIKDKWYNYCLKGNRDCAMGILGPLNGGSENLTWTGAMKPE